MNVVHGYIKNLIKLLISLVALKVFLGTCTGYRVPQLVNALANM